MELRKSSPPEVATVDPRFDGEEIAWDPAGADVPSWAVGAYLSAVGVVLLMVVSLLLAAQPANRPPDPGHTATPAPAAVPRGW